MSVGKYLLIKEIFVSFELNITFKDSICDLLLFFFIKSKDQIIISNFLLRKLDFPLMIYPFDFVH